MFLIQHINILLVLITGLTLGLSTRSSSSTSTKESAQVSATPTKLIKQQDLSDLSPASKKRRALAACKKASTRAFAKAGSESKCTDNVIKGNYASIIEALEYGK